MSIVAEPAFNEPGRRMYNTSDIRNGLKIEMDNQPFVVTYFQFVKPGKGTAFTRTKLKSLLSGNTIERTFRTGEKLQPADVSDADMQYLYGDGEFFHFMNTETYEQIGIPTDVLGQDSGFLLEEAIVKVLFYKSRPVNIELPNFVEQVHLHRARRAWQYLAGRHQDGRARDGRVRQRACSSRRATS